MARPRRIDWFAVIVVAGAFAAFAYWYFRGSRPHQEEVVITGPVTFSHDVAPIVFSKCATCHHPDEAAPFSLLTYDDVKRRARQIVEVTQSGFMPPWLPSKNSHEFVGNRSLSPRELQFIKQWVATGAELGNPAELPAAPKFVDAWQSNPPDLVLETPAYSLAGDERDVFRNFVVPMRLDEPRWIQSIELRPTNAKVTHHARVGVDSSNESVRRDAEDAEPGYAGMSWGQDPDGQLVVWAPGMSANVGTPGVAWRIYPNTALVLHTHMQPSGKPEVVQFRIGIRYAKEPPQQHPAILKIGSCDIDIPAGVKRHVVKDEYTLPVDVDVHTIFPHAHSLCTELQVIARRPDGSRVPLVEIQRFDENWHDSYRFKSPVRLPKGTSLHSTFAYDNAADNPRNPNRPPRRVVYGSNANDEMAETYLQVTAVHADQRAALMEHYKRYQLQSLAIGYTKSLEVYPDDPWIREGLATCYFGLGDPAKALATLEERLKSGPKSVYPIVSLGMAQLVRGEAAKAEVSQREAIALDDQYPLAWLGLAKALAAQKKSREAEDAYRRAMELAPGLLEARISLADALIQRGELQQAKDICLAVLSDAPEMSPIFLKLAEISAKTRKYDEALAHCQMAHQLAPYTHPPRVLLAVFCIANNDQERGKNLLREVRADLPRHPVPALYLGQLALRNGEWPQAREQLAAAAALPMPDNWPQSHQKRFQVLLHSERLQLAKRLSDADLALDALSQWLKAEPHNSRAQKMYDELSARKIGS
jgi:tetratricopeptide (TPR) repeat protein